MHATQCLYPILSKLENVTQTGSNQWSARCPIHDDRTNSLSISQGENSKALLYCHACGPGSLVEIMTAINAKWSDLFPFRSVKKNDNFKVVTEYSYRDQQGKILYQACRLEPKDFRQRSPDSSSPTGWKWSIKGIKKVPYRLPELLASQESQPIFIVEGEKDVDNLAKLGLVATCNVGGAGKWLDDYNRYFQSRHVVVIPDNDKSGMDHAEHVASSLASVAATIKILKLPGLLEKQDVSDWLKFPENTKSALLTLVLKCDLYDISSAKSQPKLSQQATKTQSQTSVASILDDNPHSLAIKFLKTIGGELDKPFLRYWRQEWYRYNGKCFVHLPAYEFKALITRFLYQEFEEQHKQQTKLFALNPVGNPPKPQVVHSSLIVNVENAILSFTALPQSINQPFWTNQKSPKRENRLVLDNGIVDIESLSTSEPTGKIDLDKILIPHTPEFFSTISLPYSYDPQATCPQWEKLLEKNLESDNDRIAILREWFGYCLDIQMSLQKCLIMQGEGANGKSVINACLTALLGENNVSNVKLEEFSRPHSMASTENKLANIVAECGDLEKVEEGLFKSFVSGDRIEINKKFRDAYSSTPTAKLVIATNNLPRFSDKSDGTWRRIILLPLRVQIPEAERIPGMDRPEYWHINGELSGIFNWAIHGLSDLRQFGKFSRSRICDVAIDQYREENNPVKVFLNDTFRVSESSEVKTKDAYASYREWCFEHGFHPVNERNFGKEISRLFKDCIRKRKKQDSKLFYVYEGIDYKESQDDPTYRNLHF